MKFKYYLRGFGTGVLVATMLLIVAMHLKENKPSDVNLSDKETSSNFIRHDGEETTQSTEEDASKESDQSKEEQVTALETTRGQKQDTESKGQFEDTTQTTDKQDGQEAQTTAPPQPDTQTTGQDGQGTQSSQNDTPAESGTTLPETTASHEQPSVEPSSVTPPSTVVITIQSGMESREAAELLQSVGLVDNASDFDEYMQQSGHESRLRIGVYEIAKGTSYEEIAEIITGNR